MLLAVCQELQLDSDFVRQGGASLFAGGMGNTGAVCGAVVGALMAIGVKKGRGETMEEALRTLALAREFRRRFELEMGTISCRELTGTDLTTEEGLQQFMGSEKPHRVCFPAVGVAFRLVVEMLREA